MAGNKRHFRILIVASEASQAEAILRLLHDARLAVRGLFTQHPQKLPGLLDDQRCDLVLVRVGGDIDAAQVAAAYTRAAADTPLLVIAPDAADEHGLVALMQAGAEGLIRDPADGRLIAQVRARVRQAGDAERRSSMKRQLAQAGETLRALIQHCPGPIVLLREGLIIAANPAFTDLMGLGAAGLPAGRPLASLAADESARELDALVSQALLLEPDDRRPTEIRLARADGSQVEARLSLLPIELGETPQLAVLVQPAAGAGYAPRGPSMDTATGLLDRAALLAAIGDRLADDGPIERSLAVVCARVEGFASICRRYGLGRGLRHAADAAATLSAAVADAALVARVADDAYAVVIEDVAETDKDALVARLEERLTSMRDDDDSPLLMLGAACGSAGNTTAARLLDLAFSDCLRRAAAQRHDAEDLPPSELQSVLKSLHLDESTQSRGAVLGDTSPSMLSDLVADESESVPLPRGPSTGGETPFGGDGSAAAANIVDDSVTLRIERALETNGFTIMYQPIISLMGDSMEHYSVLLRLRGADDRVLTARELIGPAARAGSLPDVDRWVIQRALQEQSRRRRSGQKVGCFLSLSQEIVQDERLLIWICDSLREYEIRGSWVTFQLQEREALAHADKWSQLAEGLKKIKCRICINQYGLQDDPELALTTLGADFVKFAPELAIGLSEDPVMQKRLLRLIQLAQDHGVKTIVTGVEDARSLALLWSAGIDYVQGNFLQTAMPSLEAPGGGGAGTTVVATADPPAGQ